MLASETATSPHFGILRAHLWKEGRENRTAFLLLLGVVLLACPALVLTFLHFEWATGSLPGIAAGLTLVLSMVGLGDSVLSRELVPVRCAGAVGRNRNAIVLATWQQQR